MRLSTYQRIVIGFVMVIAIGSILLSLPIFQLSTTQASFLDHLFTTTSMVCVTGLSTLPVAETYNFFGQIICVLLMQIGGLGWLTIMTLLLLMAKDKMTLKDQFILQDVLNRQSSFRFSRFIKRLLTLTFLIEGIAACLLMFDFVPRYGIFKGVWHSIFIAVSAFCNAGFDNIGASSLQSFISNPLVNIVVSVLIIFGGLGFSVWHELIDLLKNRSKKRLLSHHTRLVVITTVLLLFFGTVMTLILEWNNPKTIGLFSFGDKIMASFFQSTTMRTAGFSTIDYGVSYPSTNFIYVLLMIVGGAPGGTAGGIKVTTLAIIFLLIRSIFKGHESVTYRWRQLSIQLIKQALVIIAFFMSVLLVGYFLLLVSNPQLSPLAVWFESVSALATVGVTMGITSQLSFLGKVIIMVMMFIGRIGPVTVLLSIGQQKVKEIKHIKTTILLG